MQLQFHNDRFRISEIISTSGSETFWSRTGWDEQARSGRSIERTKKHSWNAPIFLKLCHNIFEYIYFRKIQKKKFLIL